MWLGSWIVRPKYQLTYLTETIQKASRAVNWRPLNFTFTRYV